MSSHQIFLPKTRLLKLLSTFLQGFEDLSKVCLQPVYNLSLSLCTLKLMLFNSISKLKAGTLIGNCIGINFHKLNFLETIGMIFYFIFIFISTSTELAAIVLFQSFFPSVKCQVEGLSYGLRGSLGLECNITI